MNWTPFDLTKLGQVDEVEFSLSSTKDGIPTLFCMDNMVAVVTIAY